MLKRRPKQPSAPPEDEREAILHAAEEAEEKARRNEERLNRGHLFRRKPGKKQVLRIEELQRELASGKVPADEDELVSMYMPRRRLREFGAALLRMDKLHVLLLSLLLLVAALFIAAFMQEKMGNFTINLNRLELFRKGIAIDESGEFVNPTARLTVNPVQDATNISIEDLPKNIDDIEGEHNGRNYMAYTYYLRNAGKEDVGYRASITLRSSAKGAEEAVRVAVWYNGERTVYAEPAADGGSEEGCVSFVDHDTACVYVQDNFRVGDVDRYTIVIWMEGDDPECVDAIVGGSVEFVMNIDAEGTDDSSLLVKFVQDIQDALFNRGAINAAGTDAPDYYLREDITWQNRRNQQNPPA